ncbi:PQQ-binding-like beta-propeller repeat protein [Paenibacillus sp. DMB20]|uniref:PQQ-binding-like beta-propeller repeat protein n=1 Tax=Paenibacillus sp. DMB20 TaxID=1642570 RepID=UPI00069AF6B9|nr:PQQ-binding-like beta-propeller repeat protein [Paenibacillus sp. DMB20]
MLVSPKEWHKDYMIYVPAMMWVKEADIESKEPIPDGILDADSSMPTEVARELTSYLLKQGDSALPIRKLLGKPHYKEISANLQMKDHGPLQLGETWRYERPGAQFSVTFSAAGKLKRTHWVLPSADGYQADRSGGDHYSFTYDFVTTPLARTIAEEPVWRHQGELAYTYLIGANEDVLLLKGDDGGFSGMHHNSSIYALDRATGRKLWQQDMGFGGFTAKMDGDRNAVTVYSGYNPDKKQYEDRVRHIRLSDGKLLWEVKPAKHNGIAMSSARHSILSSTSRIRHRERELCPFWTVKREKNGGKKRCPGITAY